MGEEQLIDLVRRYEAIYNIKCIEYRDSILRNTAWEEIAKLHGKPVGECKEDWNKLRNCYNNAMKRRQKKSGQAGKVIAPWRFEEQMSFLKPYLEGRPTTGNLDATVFNENVPLPSPESPYAESQTSPESIPSRTSTPTLNTSYKRKASPSTDNYLADMMDMMKSSQENRNKKQELDDLDTFFLSMSKTVKKLPRLDQIRIKMDLLKAISEAEIKQLESQQNILKTPITIKSDRSSLNRRNVNSTSGSLVQPHISYSSPTYIVELPDTEVSSEAANNVAISSPSYILEVPHTQVSSRAAIDDEETGEVEVDNIRYYYENINT